MKQQGTLNLQLKKIAFSLAVLLQFAFVNQASADSYSLFSDFVYGAGFGYGASGMDKEVEVDNVVVDVSRSETPGMLTLSVESFWNARWSLAISHRRGFRFGPFTSGTHFTGAVVRRYFLRPTPYISASGDDGGFGSVTVMNWAPYVGLGGGYTSSNTTREDEIPYRVKSSGVYMGIHLGVDYQLYPNVIFRPELFTSATFMNSSKRASTLKEFGLVMNLQFKL